MTLSVYPGSLEVVKEAIEIFGSNRVVEGGFREPITINGLNHEEAMFGRSYFEEQGKKTSIIA